MATIPTNATRDAARVALERQSALVLEIDLDQCTNTFGVAPCTATGTACYNTYATCRDKPNFARGTNTIKFCNRGLTGPLGEPLRPYILSADAAVTEIDPEKGLARRGTLTVTLADEPDSDVQLDPSITTRGPVVPGSTFWQRLMRRSPNTAGRFVRVRRGYVVSPWSWDTFVDELYIIDSLTGPDRQGNVKLTLKDPLKFADRNKVPAPTSGKLQAEIKGTENTGLVASSTSTITVLSTTASAVTGAYVGMELHITDSTGAGQRRTISAYDGPSRTCTVPAWGVLPQSSSSYEVSAIAIDVGSGNGTQYPDPATSLKREFVRIGGEIVEYLSVAGDVLNLGSSAARGAFGSTRGDHRKGDTVQLCRAWFAAPVTSVIQAILNESGLDDTYIDTAGLATAEGEWFGATFAVTACVSEPETPSSLLEELLPQISSAMFWSPPLQQAVLRVLLPSLASPPAFTDEANFVLGSVEVQAMEALRQTTVGFYYGLLDATTKGDEAKHYSRGEIAIDTDAESANGYGDRRVTLVRSRWFGEGNDVVAVAFARRRLNAVRDAPKRVSFELDPKDYTLPAGEFADLTTRRIIDDTGAALTTRVLITKVEDRGSRIACEARTGGFSNKYGFIAPNGTADHPTDTIYAHVSQNTGLMSDGSGAYLII